ncbi:MAG: flagellar hook-basal body protein [Tumebacillaceae bacterium]
MIRGLYIATSGMTANERMQEVISNNIANANTVGYKDETGVMRSFPEMLLYRLHDNADGQGAHNPGSIGMLGNGALLEEVLPRFVQGALQKSDNPNAQAIVDNPPTATEPNRRSYFAVFDGKSGQKMYTRDGDFQIDPASNRLVTSNGEFVLPIDNTTQKADANMRIVADPKTGEHHITDAQGNLVNPQNVAYDSLFHEGIIDITDSTKLNKHGDTNFVGGTEAQGTGEVQQGQLEQSNVDLSSSMVSMMNVMRSYEANQKMIRTLDDTLGKAVEVGQVNR